MSASYASKLIQGVWKGTCGDQEYFDNEIETLKKVNQLSELIKSASRIVVHTGAGVSTSSGIPDFRGPNGIWTREQKGEKPPNAVKFEEAIPTFSHHAIRVLVEKGLVHHVVTQNIDGLHLRAGLDKERLSEIHGTVFGEKCDTCHEEFTRKHEINSIGLKYTGNNCDFEDCPGKLRDQVCDWDSDLPQNKLDQAILEHRKADLVIVLGSSLRIVPAGNFPMKTYRKNGKSRNGKIVIVNLQETHLDKNAALRLFGKCDDIMIMLMNKLGVEVDTSQPLRFPRISIPLDWRHLVRAIKHQDFTVFGRSCETRESYYSHREQVLQKYCDVETFIRHSVFQEPLVLDKESNRSVLKDNRQKTEDPFIESNVVSSQRVFKFIPNDFGYNVEKHIHHYLLWSTSFIAEKEINQIVLKELGPEFRFVVYTNPPSFRTIPGIFHVHVFYCRHTDITQT